ncbi:hypothetical protein BXZ70DRAFT_899518 [Cristinia sonorae]|uniref:Uncharacterized protein n=1 Tax=Cristinia sonorae TaxID=1940300 RepID=A0A8K0UG48_9AGAR|nr:hypothetical protein BXZ70DRAFT_899518 [Cristinia sonorae]
MQIPPPLLFHHPRIPLSVVQNAETVDIPPPLRPLRSRCLRPRERQLYRIRSPNRPGRVRSHRSVRSLCVCSLPPGSSGSHVLCSSYLKDPILAFRPSFAQSLPVQILMTGIVLTLTSVLLLHLIFTAQYHWPLAPVNYALQVSAVFTLLVSLIATLQVILTTAAKETRMWPYMLTYLAVDIPPLEDNRSWTHGELAAWLLMNATTSALIQITHIQFLTLLFPSGLERRLIFALLGPLAIVAAVMQLLPMQDNPRITSIAYAVQNVCNATLSLLFTGALFIWGFFVNTKQAWRTDGGTAAFGAGALTLALASTVITFVYIPHKDQYAWMPGLMWAVILWQSFLGWWWWVGAGMGVGEVEDLMRREEKRRRKRKQKMAKRKERKEKAQTLWRDVAGAFGYETRERQERDGNTTDEGRHSDSDEGGREDRPQTARPRRRSNDSLGSTSTVAPHGFVSKLLSFRAGRSLYGWYLLLRHAHLTAAREQAVEAVERIQQVYGREGAEGQAGDGAPGVVGWGLGSYAIRQMGSAAVAGGDITEQGREGATVESEDEYEDDEKGAGGDERTVGTRRRRGRRRKQTDEEEEEEEERVLERGESRAEEGGRARAGSVWWWGPLRRWRLQDETVYS